MLPLYISRKGVRSVVTPNASDPKRICTPHTPPPPSEPDALLQVVASPFCIVVHLRAAMLNPDEHFRFSSEST